MFFFRSQKPGDRSIPCSFIIARLSKKLVPYLVLYLLSRFFNLQHGYFGQSKQNFDSVSLSRSQFITMQSRQNGGFGSALLLQPGQYMLVLMYPRHEPQFIPHGAIISFSNTISVLYFFWADVFLITVLTYTGDNSAVCWPDQAGIVAKRNILAGNQFVNVVEAKVLLIPFLYSTEGYPKMTISPSRLAYFIP